jgi:hypothetical protein
MDTIRATEGSAGVLDSTSRSPIERNADIPGSAAAVESRQEMRACLCDTSVPVPRPYLLPVDTARLPIQPLKNAPAYHEPHVPLMSRGAAFRNFVIE